MTPEMPIDINLFISLNISPFVNKYIEIIYTRNPIQIKSAIKIISK